MDTSHLGPSAGPNTGLDTPRNTGPDAGPSTEPPPRTSLVCSTCGTTPGVDDVPLALLTWSRSSDRGRTFWTCPSCSREHVRSIEGKLDPSWW